MTTRRQMTPLSEHDGGRSRLRRPNRERRDKNVEYRIHPDFKMLAAIHPPLNRKTIPMIQKAMGSLYHQQRSSRAVRVERVRIPADTGQTVRALLYIPREKKTDGCILYCHGGGYAFPAAPYQYRLARIYAQQVGCRVLFPDYRLAPAHPFPAAVEDCFASYRWLLGRSRGAGVAVCGDSAGGTLSMAVCLRAIDEGLPAPCAQLLTYPAVGNAGETESLRLYTDTPMCNSRDMDIYGAWYVQDEVAGKLAYRSPIEAESVEEVPVTYIETAEFDALRDGAILYAEKLRAEGIEVELHNTEGTVHGYDMMLHSGVVKDLIGKRVAFLKRVLR